MMKLYSKKKKQGAAVYQLLQDWTHIERRSRVTTKKGEWVLFTEKEVRAMKLAGFIRCPETEAEKETHTKKNEQYKHLSGGCGCS